jgi:tripartite-type tricarboxylate transporter receptor subunit TctC
MGISTRKLAALLIAGFILGPLTALPAAAQSYPSRNITAIIPFAAGNANDVTARIVFEQLQKQLGQPIVIESKPGAGGTIGVGQAAKATPDGYTVLFHSATFSASYVTHKWLPYETLGDFTAVSAVGISPSVLVASPSKGYKTAADLVTAAKANPGKLDFASAGIGAASHLAAAKFNIAAGINAQHIPFKGPVEAMAELMAGRIDYYFLPLAAAIAQIKGGTVTALAVSSDKRAPQLPDVPTTAEIGYPAAAYAFWNGLFVPAKTPPDVVAKLYQETQKAIADPTVKERLAKVGVEPLVMSQPEFQKYFEADVKSTDELAKKAGIEKQ